MKTISCLALVAVSITSASARALDDEYCHKTCLNETGLKCATNGITYTSFCEMNRASCTTSLDWKRDGWCPRSPVSPEVQNTVFASGTLCKDMYCPAVEYEPVCGCDGKTYTSNCEMRLASCNSKDLTISRVAIGTCPTGMLLPQQAPFCDPINKAGFCADMMCPTADSPVCGSNGVMYRNECELRLDSCKNPTSNILMADPSHCAH